MWGRGAVTEYRPFSLLFLVLIPFSSLQPPPPLNFTGIENSETGKSFSFMQPRNKRSHHLFQVWLRMICQLSLFICLLCRISNRFSFMQPEIKDLTIYFSLAFFIPSDASLASDVTWQQLLVKKKSPTSSGGLFVFQPQPPPLTIATYNIIHHVVDRSTTATTGVGNTSLGRSSPEKVRRWRGGDLCLHEMLPPIHWP